MLTQPQTKYRSLEPIHLPDRTWPTKTITQPPIWLSTDLRDGNQALIEPMNLAQKLQMFNLLVQVGFKEIEVGFPSASQIEFDFIRHLIEHHLIPDDVIVQVLVPAREALIHRTFEALKGVPRAIVHVYNATAPVFREVVFGKSRLATIQLATTAAQLIYDLASEYSATQWQFQYSPEVFTSTELDFAGDICNAVLEIWQPTLERKAIINLPATVEVATPNVFADQVEWMHRHLAFRDSVTLCVHTHNDRGCSIAAAELAQMAGAERVEGCLFGNGERTGNVDLVTLAMNLYTQGIHPDLDFSQIDEVAQIVRDCTQLPIHPRHPYVGELVFTAFSGSHQDAIKKGFAVQKSNARWRVPYLPIDPVDVGRTYESVVRVNSQSGKGGIAFLLERDYGLVLPRSLQVELSQIAQRAMDLSGQELSAADLWQLFTHEYLQGDPFKYRSHQMIEAQAGWEITAELEYKEQPLTVQGQGNGPIDAFLKALDRDLQVHHYEERALGYGSDAVAIAIIQLDLIGAQETHHGVGMHNNIVTASLLAVLSALNRSNQ
jgi:2-isopropylmalate synthase